jgi:hypothetical protein
VYCSKGFEGAIAIHDLNNELVVLGLCEGNFCSEKYKSKTGNGRVVAMRKNTSGDTCVWETIKGKEMHSSGQRRKEMNESIRKFSVGGRGNIFY